jgi:hypothetical protein
MRRWIGTSTLSLAAALAVPAAFAQDTGREWISLTAEEARIVFVAPDLDKQRVRYLRAEAEDHNFTLDVAVWTGAAAPHAKAVVQYVASAPDRHFRARNDPRNTIESFAAFADKDLDIGRLERGGNRLGMIESRRVSFDDVECLSFAVYWGQSGGDRDSAGTDLIYGYYCADPGQPLSEETRKAVIVGLGVKGQAVP